MKRLLVIALFTLTSAACLEPPRLQRTTRQVERAMPTPTPAHRDFVKLPPRIRPRPGQMSVTYVNSFVPSEFWGPVCRVMFAAAKDLDIALELLDCRADHLRCVEMLQEVVNRPNPPDYVMLNNFRTLGRRYLQTLRGTGVKSFFFQHGFTAEETKVVGVPRQHHKNWIGSLRTDQIHAGHTLALAGLKAARRRFPPPHRAIYITGGAGSTAGSERAQGASKAFNEAEDGVLQQVALSYWKRPKARAQALGLLRRWPQTTLLLASNDPMAFGAADAAIELGRTPGADVLVAGINWSRDALGRIQRGEMVATVGGHFLGGGFSLVLLRDYHDGHDFASEGLELPFRMQTLDRSNTATYLRHLGDNDWSKIDFRRFCKSRNPAIKRYDFSLKKLLSKFD